MDEHGWITSECVPKGHSPDMGMSPRVRFNRPYPGGRDAKTCIVIAQHWQHLHATDGTGALSHKIECGQ